MSTKHYDWRNPPELEAHSKIKHEILRKYILDYIAVYAKNPSVSALPMYFVDGFAGGGKYWFKTKANIVSGSPFVMLESCLEGESTINSDRQKNPFQMQGEFFFIDSDKYASEGLKKNIEHSQHKSMLDSGRIRIIKKDFNRTADDIIAHIESRNANARAFFLLDQYGYNKISVNLINQILSRLPNAEIVLNFNVDSLISYISEDNLDKFLQKTNFSLHHLRGQIERLWENGDSNNRRQVLQKYIYDAITRDCGAEYYEGFFIKNPHGYGIYWLIHMSRRPRARHVMNAIGWNFGNDVVQYASDGLDRFNMLGYNPSHDERFVAGELEIFAFSPTHQQLTLERLADQIPRMAHDLYREGVLANEFINATCNHTGASWEQYLQILTSLHAGHEITLYDEDHKPLRRGAKAKATHSLIVIPQNRLFQK